MVNTLGWDSCESFIWQFQPTLFWLRKYGLQYWLLIYLLRLVTNHVIIISIKDAKFISANLELLSQPAEIKRAVPSQPTELEQMAKRLGKFDV